MWQQGVEGYPMTEARVDLEDTILSVGDRVKVLRGELGNDIAYLDLQGTVTRLNPTTGEVDERVPGVRAESNWTCASEDLVKV